MNAIRDEWERFASEVIPADASPSQRRDMALAFYAGAYAILLMQVRNREMSDGAITGLTIAWYQECEAVSTAYAQGGMIP